MSSGASLLARQGAVVPVKTISLTTKTCSQRLVQFACGDRLTGRALTARKSRKIAQRRSRDWRPDVSRVK